MSGEMIPVEEAIAEWRKDPEYAKAYDVLEEGRSATGSADPPAMKPRYRQAGRRSAFRHSRQRGDRSAECALRAVPPYLGLFVNGRVPGDNPGR
jgi:hypothetical protein